MQLVQGRGGLLYCVSPRVGSGDVNSERPVRCESVYMLLRVRVCSFVHSPGSTLKHGPVTVFVPGREVGVSAGKAIL